MPKMPRRTMPTMTQMTRTRDQDHQHSDQIMENPGQLFSSLWTLVKRTILLNLLTICSCSLQSRFSAKGFHFVKAIKVRRFNTLQKPVTI